MKCGRLPTMLRFAESHLPTEWGAFRVRVYRTGQPATAQSTAVGGMFEEHVALIMGDVRGDDVLVRVHSSCFTGEVLGSLRCDCRAQLQLALRQIAAEQRGVLIYLVQEGRGIGLGNKIAAYALQDAGVDTVDANVALGFSVDNRSYELAAEMLRDAGVASVRLITNNPDKTAGLRANGILVTTQVSAWTDAAPESHEYLRTKRERLGHQ